MAIAEGREDKNAVKVQQDWHIYQFAPNTLTSMVLIPANCRSQGYIGHKWVPNGSQVIALVHLQPLFLALKSGLAQLNEFWVDPMIQRRQNLHPQPRLKSILYRHGATINAKHEPPHSSPCKKSTVQAIILTISKHRD